MKTQRLAIILTLINLALLVFLLVKLRPAVAQDSANTLRGRALEIVDEQGRVRAQIIVTPATTKDGRFYAESSLLRLIDPNGRPAVKIGGSVDGSGMSLAGDSERRDWSGVQILSQDAVSTIKLTNKDGSVKDVTP